MALEGGVIFAVSVSVSRQERMAATVELGIGLIFRLLLVLVLFRVAKGVSRAVVVRRRKLTRFKNDGLVRVLVELKGDRNEIV